MARAAAPTAYKPLVVEADQPPAAEPDDLLPPERRADSEQLLKDVAQSVLVYIHPDAHKALLRYSVEQSTFRGRVRVHDLIIEAIEMFFESKGLQGPVRAKDRTKPGQGGQRRTR